MQPLQLTKSQLAAHSNLNNQTLIKWDQIVTLKETPPSLFCLHTVPRKACWTKVTLILTPTENTSLMVTRCLHSRLELVHAIGNIRALVKLFSKLIRSCRILINKVAIRSLRRASANFICQRRSWPNSRGSRWMLMTVGWPESLTALLRARAPTKKCPKQKRSTMRSRMPYRPTVTKVITMPIR